MIELKRILLATDFSDNSRRATQYASELARTFGSQIDVLHVLDTPIMAMPSPGAPFPDALLNEINEDAQKHLESWIPDEVKATTTINLHMKQGSPFVEIIRFAKETNADLIVIGTHGRGGLTHALIGSVAERVVRKASCPVLTIHNEGHQFVMP